MVEDEDEAHEHQSVRTMLASGAWRDAPSIMACTHASLAPATIPLRAALVATKVADRQSARSARWRASSWPCKSKNSSKRTSAGTGCSRRRVRASRVTVGQYA